MQPQVGVATGFSQILGFSALTVVMGYSGFWMDSSRTLFPPAGSSVLVGLVILLLVEKLKKACCSATKTASRVPHDTQRSALAMLSNSTRA